MPAPDIDGHPVELRWDHLKTASGLHAILTRILDVYNGRLAEILWLAVGSPIFLSDGRRSGYYADVNPQ